MTLFIITIMNVLSNINGETITNNPVLIDYWFIHFSQQQQKHLKANILRKFSHKNQRERASEMMI
jgi:hypothetical protein